MDSLNDQRVVNLLLSNDPKSIHVLILRFSWSLLSWLPFVLPGRQLSCVRVALLRLFGAKIGSNVLISSGVHIWFPWHLSIGDCSAIGRSVEIYNYQNVLIGAHTVISQYSYLCTASHDYTTVSMDFFAKPIEICDYVWIAAGVMVCPGVIINKGAVVGARSFVTSNMSAWTVNIGSPARKIKDRLLD
jgi:putative colanic acid biosynthesis acetyltransferase WcaF